VSVGAATGSPLAPAFEEAIAARPDEVRVGHAWMGGRRTALRVAGRDLFDSLHRTLAPAPDDGPADLRIDLWDAVATGVPVPDGPPLYGGRRDLAGGWLVRSPDGRWLAHHHPDVELWVDRARGHLVGGVRTRRESIGWHPARPLQTILIPWLASLGLSVVHAATVAQGGVAALVAGPSGQGKSTTAAASLAAGLQLLGDDTVALEETGDGWLAHTVHATVKTRTAAAQLHAGAVALGGAWEGESVLYVNEAQPEAVAASARVAAVLLPRLSDRPDSRVEPVKAGAALAVLTGAALSLEPGEIAAGFERVSALAEAVPAFRLHVGREPGSIPRAIAPLLADLRGS
jgi:hypothetical protein